MDTVEPSVPARDFKAYYKPDTCDPARLGFELRPHRSSGSVYGDTTNSAIVAGVTDSQFFVQINLVTLLRRHPLKYYFGLGDFVLIFVTLFVT